MRHLQKIRCYFTMLMNLLSLTWGWAEVLSMAHLFTYWAEGPDRSYSLCPNYEYVYLLMTSYCIMRGSFLLTITVSHMCFDTKREWDCKKGRGQGQPQVTGPQVKYSHTKWLQIPPLHDEHIGTNNIWFENRLKSSKIIKMEFPYSFFIFLNPPFQTCWSSKEKWKNTALIWYRRSNWFKGQPNRHIAR